MSEFAIRLSDILPSQEALEAMGRRRYTRPSVLKTKASRPQWYIRAQVPRLVEGGRVVSEEISYYFGFCDEKGKRAAEKERDELLKTINRTPELIQSQVPFAQIAKLYRESALPLRRINTRVNYESRLDRWILPQFGTKRVCDIATVDIQRWCNSLPALSTSSRKGIIGTLSSVFETAIEWGYLSRNPVRRIVIGDSGEEWDRRPLKPEEARRLLMALPEPYGLMARLALYTGLRVGEILGLTWEAVDLVDQRVTVRQKKTQRGTIERPKTEAGKRQVVLDADLCARFHAIRPEGAHGLIWPDIEYEMAKRHLRSCGKRLKIRWRGMGWHTFRRTYASWAAEILPAIPAELVTAMGHTKGSMTSRYITIAEERQRMAIAAMREQVDSIHTPADARLM